MNTRWDTVPVGDGKMSCYVGLPQGSGPFPGVMVCMHAPGVDEFITGIVHRLAASGFVAIAPDLYHRDQNALDAPKVRMGRLLDRQILQDLDAATRHLRDLPEVSAERTGAIGFCMGGRVAYLYASEDSQLRVAVVFYGGKIRVPWGEHQAPFDRTERISCPILGLFGEEDTNPSPADVAMLDAELKRTGKVHEFYSYAGAGHAFLNHLRSSYRPEAAVDAWSKCEAALTRYLRP